MVKNVVDFRLYVVSAVAAVVVIAVLIKNKVNLKGELTAGVATFGALNNFANVIYYIYIFNGESDLNPGSFRGNI